ncbi:hypothetical protein [Geothrix edaphica]|uniref:hypothetical protein n=1 Tax=Geothrix edaphica TaxID=2927976 RepID=UPI0025531250|nr:hypothetical protein [Geothrix edaphica]
MFKSTLLALYLLANLSSAATVAIGQEVKRPIQRVFLGSFGNEDYGAWFRLLVEEELIANGFQIVAATEKPDATLAGIIVRQTPADPSGSQYPEGLVRLHLPSGKVVWRYRPTGGLGNHTSPPEAGRLVKALIKAIDDGQIASGD